MNIGIRAAAAGAFLASFSLASAQDAGADAKEMSPLKSATDLADASGLATAGLQAGETPLPGGVAEFGGKASAEQAAENAALAARTAEAAKMLGMDFDAMLKLCGENTGGCAAALQRALGRITAARPGMPPAVVEQLMGSLATIAVATALEADKASAAAALPAPDTAVHMPQQQGSNVALDLGAFLTTLANEAPESLSVPLSAVARDVVSGNIKRTDLTAVAGSPS